MKLISYFLPLCLLISGITNAQANDTTASISRWVGLWTGTFTSDSVAIFLTHSKSPAENDLKYPIIALYGWHTIYTFDTVLESTMKFAGKEWNENSSIIGIVEINAKSLGLTIQDKTRNRSLLGTFHYLSDTMVLFTAELTESLSLDFTKYPSGQSFPKKMILRKHKIEVPLPRNF